MRGRLRARAKKNVVEGKDDGMESTYTALPFKVKSKLHDELLMKPRVHFLPLFSAKNQTEKGKGRKIADFSSASSAVNRDEFSAGKNECYKNGKIFFKKRIVYAFFSTQGFAKIKIHVIYCCTTFLGAS